MWTPNADLRALMRPGPGRRLAVRRAHTRTRAPARPPRSAARLPGPPAPPLPAPAAAGAVRRALCGAAGPGGGGGRERGGGGAGGAGAQSRLARAPPAGRGFSSLGADAADLPAAAADHGRQRDAVSAAGGRPGARGGGRGEGAAAGGGPSPRPGCAFAASRAAPAPARRRPTLLQPRSLCGRPLGQGRGVEETRTRPPLRARGFWPRRHAHTHSLADTRHWAAGAGTQRAG